MSNTFDLATITAGSKNKSLAPVYTKNFSFNYDPLSMHAWGFPSLIRPPQQPAPRNCCCLWTEAAGSRQWNATAWFSQLCDPIQPSSSSSWWGDGFFSREQRWWEQISEEPRSLRFTDSTTAHLIVNFINSLNRLRTKALLASCGPHVHLYFRRLKTSSEQRRRSSSSSWPRFELN